MPRKSRNPDNRSDITPMSAEAQGRYQAMKQNRGAWSAGWGQRSDPWNWTTSTADSTWFGRASAPNGAWPPVKTASKP